MNKYSIKRIALFIGFFFLLIAIWGAVLFRAGSFDHDKIVRYEGNFYADTEITSALRPFKNLNSPMIMESTPIQFKGELYAIASIRSAAIVDGLTKIRIDRFNSRSQSKLAEIPVSDFGLISAIAYNDKVYVFGVTRWDRQNEIRVIVSEDLISWSKPRTIYQAGKDQIIFNTSASANRHGVVLAYEVSEPDIEGTQLGAKGFSPRFIKSNDLQEWTSVGDLFTNEEAALYGGKKYSACPTLKYSEGKYYMTYLAYRDNKYITLLARSNDLKNWEYADKPMFVPAKGEGNNNSDVDFVEGNGRVYFLYHTGDQQTWGNLKLSEYLGSEKSLLQEFTYHGAGYIRTMHRIKQLKMQLLQST